MKRSSRKFLVAKPIRLRASRHHASEAWKPRPTDLCADRVAALATCVALRGAPLVMPNGERLDARALETMAEEQRAREADLQETFGKTRVVYEDYHHETRRVRDVLDHGIDHFAASMEKADPVVRTALRTARLRRPPKTTIARLRAIVAKKREGGDASSG